MHFAFKIDNNCSVCSPRNLARNLILLSSALLLIGLTRVETALVGTVAGSPRVPCYFVFGDSLVDCGNNNDLETSAKANYPPYGIDFPTGVNGRFTNGRTIADLIGLILSLHLILCFTTYLLCRLLKLQTYGFRSTSCGSAGIREESGSHLTSQGDRVCLDKQLKHHEAIFSRIADLQQNKTLTDEHLRKCIYIVNIGNNDYINNYLMPEKYTTSHQHKIPEYAEVLAQQYTQQLKKLYSLGGRKIAVFGLGMIGCAPAEMDRSDTKGHCVDWINDAVMLFNDRLKPLVDELNGVFPDARFTFINLTNILAPKGGEQMPNKPCCPVIPDGQCVPNAQCCPSRSLSVYLDSFHPTEIANLVLATRAYSSQSSVDASPYDIGQLTREIISDS
ncbi:GDSL esterase/lipase At1g29670-like [Bidens hawaiensis]|uniref:GDSL esterase/lipase At1g29670-like n=1 Tax=Bidens hawaiensis TaxID=980011 RepID=UPI004049CEFC